jgi:hypothetical protein
LASIGDLRRKGGQSVSPHQRSFSRDPALASEGTVAAILKQVSQGKMSVSTGRDLVAMIDVQRKSIELVEIEKRIEALEQSRGD